MNTFLRILACLALVVSGLAAALDHVHIIPPGTLSPDLIKRMMIASVLLLGAKEGIVAIGDILDDGKRNGSFSIERLRDKAPLLLFGFLLLFLPACTNDGRFLGMNGSEWGGLGKTVGGQLPAIAMRAYLDKQAINVQPSTPTVPANPPTTTTTESASADGWISSLFNLLN